MRFELQNNHIVRYLRLTSILGLSLSVVPLFAMLVLIFIKEGVPRGAFITVIGSLIVIFFLIVAYIQWYAQQYANSLDYQLEDNILYIEEGVFTYSRKAIPLDRVTDIRLIQNIYMRWIGFWKIQIQTASSGEMGAEGTLWAVDAPKEIRNQLLTARNTAVKSQFTPAA